MFESPEVAAAAAEFPELAAAIAAVPVRPGGGVTGAPGGARVRALLVLTRQLEARLSGHVASFDVQGLAAADGLPSTAAWIRVYGRVDSGAASRMVRSARLLEVLPRFAVRFAEGMVGPEHVAAVASGASRVPDDRLAQADATIADFAARARPSELRVVAERVQACYDAESVAKDSAYRYQSRHLSLAQPSRTPGIWRAGSIRRAAPRSRLRSGR